jgi:hypothetical protein
LFRKIAIEEYGYAGKVGGRYDGLFTAQDAKNFAEIISRSSNLPEPLLREYFEITLKVTPDYTMRDFITTFVNSSAIGTAGYETKLRKDIAGYHAGKFQAAN